MDAGKELAMQTAKVQLTRAELEALERHPRHSGVLLRRGIQLPQDAIVVVCRRGIKILLNRVRQAAS